MSLRWRIALPFAVLFAAVFTAVTVVAAALVVRAVERRLASRADHLATILAQAPGLEASPSLLGYIRDGFEADVAVEVRGAVSATTIPAVAESLTAGLQQGSIRRESGTLQPFGSFLVTWSPISPDRNLLLLYRPEIVEAAKVGALGPLILVAGIGLVLVCVLAYLTARTIARPIERLSVTAREVAGGKLDVKMVHVGGGSEIDRLVGAFRDMLEGLKMHQEKQLQAERLAVLGQMAAGVAHEIRNPLSAMKMTVQMLREEAADREPHDLLLREIERLELAASELFNSAHPARLQKERAELTEISKEVLTLLRPQLDHLSVRVERKFSSPMEADVDRNIFKRAIMNLVLNGAQAVNNGGTLTVGTEGRNGQTRFFVRDNGPGIPEEVQGRLFEPFVTTKKEGIGLGLAVTKRLVEDHGGTIGFDTSPTGTTFWIDLPDRHG